MWIFQSVRWKNFLATGNSWTEVNLNQPGCTLIVGENGAGKSTLLDAICFALYGRAFRNINKPQLVNAINNGDCVVELSLLINNVPYLIRRGIKPTIFQVFKNGVEVEDYFMESKDGSVRDQQALFEQRILGINFKTFSQIVILSAINFIPFLALTAQARRQFVEDVLCLKPFSTMNVLAKAEYNHVQDLLKQQDYQYSATKQSVDSLQEVVEQAQNNITNIVGIHQEEYQTNQAKIIELNDRIVADQQAYDLLETKKQEINYQKIIELKNKLASYKTKLVEKIEKLKTKNDVCPTCKRPLEQELTEEQRADTLAATRSTLEEVEQKEQQLNQSYNNYNDLVKQQQQISSNIQVHKHKVSWLTQECKKLKEKIQQIETQHQTINVDKISELNQQLVKIEQQKIQHQHRLGLYNIILDLLKDNGIKSQIIKHYVPIINQVIEKYMNAFDFYVGFEFDENFSEIIKSRHRDEFSYASFSQGEKSRIDLALLFAWREIASIRNSVKTNLLIMDEVLDSSLDALGINMLFDIIDQQSTSIIIISHREGFEDRVNNVIKFEKRNNFSQVAENE